MTLLWQFSSKKQGERSDFLFFQSQKLSKQKNFIPWLLSYNTYIIYIKQPKNL